MGRHLVSVLLAAALLSSGAHAAVVYDQPHNGTGALNKSSWYAPNGLDGDVYCWDGFSFASNTAVASLRWRGGYEYHPSGSGQAPVSAFTISIYRSIGGNSQPDMGTGGRLANYDVSGAAGETVAGAFGGVQMYDYSFTLPSAFQAAAGTVYWVEIVASQGAAAPSYAPDWGLATGTGGNGTHFRFTTGSVYQTVANDLAFTLLSADAPTVTIAASASPAYAGSVAGAGAYAVGSTASLTATANLGYGFVSWTEGASQVSTSPTYSFTASVNRTLVANFDTAYTVTTAAYPAYGGSAGGGGTYTHGATVTVTATPSHGFVFNSWSDGATTATHTFPATSNVWLTAFFDQAPDAATYDFDGGPYQASLPLAWTVNGVTATFTGGYSTQAVGTLGIAPAGFSGWCLWPNSVFASDLGIKFSVAVKGFSVLYAVHELACDTSARMRVTAYLAGVLVGTNTTQAVPGTYPSATLSLTPGASFDSVVVHWDAPGTLCQDYGPIFWADNVTVTRASMAGVGPDTEAGMLRLEPAAPNPFQRATALRFVLPRAGDVHLGVYDAAGRRVRTLASGPLSAGAHAVSWDGCDDAGRRLSPSVYVVRLQTAGGQEDRRVVMLR